ncbi:MULTISPECIES: hypothetical protein [Burkholderia]|uniref:hypothetical protein n=1 Tax=Burkholderia TaxID=32008 RepID=UPI000F54139B|nr:MULTISPECIES: hypothetical protein [Burkholderia]MBJ9712921.1 hypothetical protein [Burkholderia gladioli]MBU9153559.1 hypothetical protein [Burkholderia gladioli]MCH7270419.1 hypothetical protein [Burkholderia gladioli]MDC6129690.1 hypothetical protein [Burkholderia gladioli]MDN7737146.1 hypothetical protein [Burkholderia gladioli]
MVKTVRPFRFPHAEAGFARERTATTTLPAAFDCLVVPATIRRRRCSIDDFTSIRRRFLQDPVPAAPRQRLPRDPEIPRNKPDLKDGIAPIGKLFW